MLQIEKETVDKSKYKSGNNASISMHSSGMRTTRLLTVS